MTSQQKVRIDDEMLAPSSTGIIEFEVRFLGKGADGEPVYFRAYFDDIDKQTENAYRRIANDNYRSTKLKPKKIQEGIEFLFDKKFRNTDIDWNIYQKDASGEFTDEVIGNILEKKGYVNEKEYFQKDAQGKRYLNPMCDKYWSLVHVDTDDTKD